MAQTKQIPAPIEFHAVRNADGTYNVTLVTEVRSRMGAEGARNLGKQETVIKNCNFTATVYGEHSPVEIGERKC